ncbi:metallophosphoesterase family protein [Bradyrhizobium tropiciagri]|uniref:metallophosphoesterase family protein n=1 Tax=Bradyrhizobium tropiciagri TaxID=312253 RepID=UPI00067C8726|nr:metallophosphoesterase [Bradyrhizobium tropiciagri]
MDVLAISDIHLERRGLRELPPLNESFDLLICAGDVWEGQPEKAVRSIVELARGKPAIIVPGNHDVYSVATDRRTVSDVLRIMRQEADRHNAQAHSEIVTILSADHPVHEIEQVRFIGLTLWSDWALAGRWMEGANDIEWPARARALASHMRSRPREYGAITTERGAWTPYDAVAEHAREKAVLLDELVASHDGPTVVVTHHPPLGQCVDAYRNIAPWWAPAFYASDILPTLAEHIQPDVWICGHVHAPFDNQFGRTRVICNPVEGGNFNPNLVIEIENER